MSDCISYADALVTFRDLLDDGVDGSHYSEYVRGGVNLIADLFGREGMDVSTRMDEVMEDLKQIPQHTPIFAVKIADGRLNHIDMNGVRNQEWDGNIESRFEFNFHSYDPQDEDEWKYKIELTDNKFLDSDGLPITAIAGGVTYSLAVKRASEMIGSALEHSNCIF